MNFPQFAVSRFGFFDSDVNRIGEQVGKDRLVSGYELDFYTEDYEGGQTLDGVFYPARRNGVTLAKPGQTRALYPPYKCYFLNIVTQDPTLQEMFSQMPVMFSLWDMEEAVQLFQQMLELDDKASLEGRLRFQSCVCQLLGMLCRCCGIPVGSSQKVSRHQKMLADVERYIREHLDADLSLEALAKIANLDASYFHKVFTSFHGITPAKMVISYRIAAAKIELIEGKLPMDALAAKCGFSSTSYFCYKFKKVVGSSPSRYKQLVLRQMKN